MDTEVRKARQKSYLWAGIGAIALLGVFFGIITAANSFDHAVAEFVRLWYWIVALSAGFGTQVGLYVHVRQTVQLRKQAQGATPAVATAGGVSTVSMVACCAHHLTDFLPVLGLSAAAAFLSAYQLVFIVAGILSNIFGITFMLSIIARHGLYTDANRWLARLSAADYARVLKIEIPVLVAVFLVTAVSFLPPHPVSGNDNTVKRIALEEREVAASGVWVDVAGEYDRALGTLALNITFTTHSGSLDFQVDKIASLIINGQEVSLPAVWNGAPPGGHHVSGVLLYRDLPADVDFLTLRLSAEGRLGNREFTWEL
ncbi:MAG: hypothetical protein ACE5LH_04300 [Fidelibacterota bacterium]